MEKYLTLVLLIAGCNPGNLSLKTSDTTDSNTDTIADSDDSSDPDTETGDTGEEPSCEFSVWNGHWNEDGTQMFVSTAVAPQYSLHSASYVTASANEDVTVEFSIASQDGCGDLNYNFFMFYVWSEDTTWDWMREAVADRTRSSLQVVDPVAEWDSSAYINTPEDPNLRYCWTDEEILTGCDGVIPTQVINDETVYRFVWQQSDYPPPGSHLRIELVLGAWTDPQSGEEIHDYNASSAISVGVIIE